MSSKIALKRLTASDLTFFKWHFETYYAGNQKAINLNANIFIKEFYPLLPEIINQKNGKLPLDLYIYGPGLSTEYNIQRKIQKKGSYKNYRLNGEFIADPETDSERFHQLRPDDLIILDFEGEIQPESARAVFISQDNPEDHAIHSALSQYIGNRSMIVFLVTDLEKIITNIGPSKDHPVYLLLQEEWMEEAAYGGIDGIKALRTGPYKGEISPEELDKAKRNADSIGKRGEEFVAVYLEQLKAEDKIKDFVWVSYKNAIAPYDFEITNNEGSITYVDVKSTKGDFKNNIHISFNELLQIREETLYYIYRVFGIHENTATLCTAKVSSKFAEDIIEVLEKLPAGVNVTSISLNPKILFFDQARNLTIPEEEE